MRRLPPQDVDGPAVLMSVGPTDDCRVLLVDDDAVTRTVLRAGLERIGCVVDEAPSGEAALGAFGDAFDVVVLDVMLPDMLGFDVCRAMRSRSVGERPAILMMTSKTDVASIERAFASGATEFITKPFRPVLLAHRVRYLFRSIQAHLEVARLAYTDEATGLPNRAALTLELDRWITRARRSPFAVFCMGINNAQRLRDTLGEGALAKVSQSVARRIVSNLQDTAGGAANIVARIDGDRFVVALQPVVGTPHEVAADLIEAVKPPLSIENHQVFVHANVGCAWYPRDGNGATAMVRAANAALSAARGRGVGSVEIYQEVLTEDLDRPLRIEDGLRKALLEESLTLHYQPQLDLRTGRVTGAEALIRWPRPGKPPISPGEFIPVAEESDLIIQIGSWVLATAARQLREWNDAGMPRLRMSVNVAPRQFRDPHFVDEVREAVSRHSLLPGELEIELTEGALMDDTARSIRSLSRLRKLGVRVAIDDFGTGYSSLAYLSRFPIDVVKMDRSFVRKVPESATDVAIARAVLSMGRSLGLEVVAEGVETEAQQAFFAEEACQTMQGYLCSRPVSAPDFVKWLAARPQPNAQLCRLHA